MDNFSEADLIPLEKLGFDIALTGGMRSGKDTVYKILSELGYRVHRVAFGDMLKDRFHDTFQDIPWEPKPIQHYIDYGQAMRAIDEDVWVKALRERVRYIQRNRLIAPNIVITDVRQPNEFKYARENGFVIVKVEANPQLRVYRMRELGEEFNPDLFTQPTELHMQTQHVDYVLHNHTVDREELKSAVERLIRQIRRDRGL